MTELVKGSTERPDDAAATHAVNLLWRYGFELAGYSIDQLLSSWLESYPINWIRLAIVEALYQGRYKAISVEQILTLWQRRGQPSYHFNHEFEHLVCHRFPRSLVSDHNDTAPGSDIGQHSMFHQEATLNPMPRQLARLKSQLATHPSTVATSVQNGQSVPYDPPPPPLLPAPAPTLTPALTPALTSTDLPIVNPHHNDVADHSLPPSEPAAQSLAADVTVAVPSISQPPLSVGDRTIPSHGGAPSHNGMDSATVADAMTVPVTTASPADVLLTGKQTTAANLALANVERNDQSPKPKRRLPLNTLYQPNWLISTASKQPINQFTPILECSEFDIKLRAVAQPNAAEPEAPSLEADEP